MNELKYSLVIEATDDPNFFGFYSPELENQNPTVVIRNEKQLESVV